MGHYLFEGFLNGYKRALFHFGEFFREGYRIFIKHGLERGNVVPVAFYGPGLFSFAIGFAYRVECNQFILLHEHFSLVLGIGAFWYQPLIFIWYEEDFEAALPKAINNQADFFPQIHARELN